MRGQVTLKHELSIGQECINEIKIADKVDY